MELNLINTLILTATELAMFFVVLLWCNREKIRIKFKKLK